MRQTLLLGVDLGTGGCKITIIDNVGNIVGEAQKEYPTSHPQSLYSEQNPDDWIIAFIEALKIVEDSSDIKLSDIAALSVDASTHNAVLLDKNMEVIRPTIMWTDQRSINEVKNLEKNWGEDIFRIGYQKVSPTWTLPQLLWIKNNEPQNYRKIHKIMFVKDYLRYKLTGNWETDYIDAQGTLMFDMKERKWSDKLCNIIELDIRTLPPLCMPTDITGKITSEAANLTGLAEGIPVIAGTSDSAVEDYAAGAINPGQCILKLATAGNVNVMTDKPHPNPLTLTYSHVIPDMWYTVSATNTAASAMRWFRDNFCFEEIQKSKESGYNVFQLIDREISKIPPGSEGLFFHPYLLGERAPYWDPFLRASFVGVTMAHRKAHFLRALMEGVSFSLKDCYRVIENMGIEVNEFILIGGGSKSDIWSQIICDIFREKVTRPATSDASYGTALLAGVGVGIFSSLKEAVKKCNKAKKEYIPDYSKASLYEKLFKIYLKIHDQLEPIYRSISSFNNKKRNK